MDLIFQSLRKIEGWKGAILRFIIPLYFFLGLRVSELRKAHIEDLDMYKMEFLIRYPKGSGNWADKEKIKIPLSVKSIIDNYLRERNKKFNELGIKNNIYLIPNLSNRNVSGMPYSDNSFRRFKKEVENTSGINFELRALRRTHGQYILDNAGTVDIASRSLRHNNTNTTERYYARVKQSKAFDTVNSIFSTSPLTDLFNGKNSKLKN